MFKGLKNTINCIFSNLISISYRYMCNYNRLLMFSWSKIVSIFFNVTIVNTQANFTFCLYVKKATRQNGVCKISSRWNFCGGYDDCDISLKVDRAQSAWPFPINYQRGVKGIISAFIWNQVFEKSIVNILVILGSG